MTLASLGPPYEQLKSVFASLTGSEFPIYWSDEPKAISTKGFVELHEVSIVSIGQDEQRREYDPATHKQTTYLLGNRKWIVQCRIGVLLPAKQIRATAVMERLKMRFGKPLAFAQYKELNLAMIDWGTTISQPLQQDTRMISSATCDFSFGFRNVDVDNITTNESWIETVDGGSFAGKGTFTP